MVTERCKNVSPLASASSATGTPGTLAMSNSEGAESGHKWKERWDTLPPPPTLISSKLVEGHELR